MSVELTRRDEFGLLTLRRPEKLNALSFAILGEIAAAFDEAGSWPIRALLITGAGEKAFCAGADIEELRDSLARRPEAGRGNGASRVRQARRPALSLDRAHQRLRLWRRARIGDGLHVPPRLAARQNGPAGNQARPHSRLRRHAAAAAADRRGAGAGIDHDRANGRRRRGLVDGARQPDRRGRHRRRRRQPSRANSPGTACWRSVSRARP